ncbi:MAG: pentapeptide repeat-containing protein [Prosthecobacter sp.]
MNEILKSQKIADRSFEEEEIAAPAQFIYCTLTRCNFEQARISTNLGSAFEDCSFRGANLTESVLRGRFVRCDFTEANLSRTRASEVTFEDCVFREAAFTKVTYHWIKFVRCRFEDCKFRKGEIGSSTFEDCEWIGNDVADVFCENTKIPAQQGVGGQPATPPRVGD